MRFLQYVVAVALVATLPVGAVAQQAEPSSAQAELDARARLHFQAGSSHYETGDYEAAAREFRAAYELSRRPGLLFNTYMAYERMGRFDEAISYLERYLAEAENIENRAALELRLTRLRERAAATRATSSEEEGSTSSRQTARDAGPDLTVPAIISFAVGGAGLLTFAIFGGLAVAEDASLADSCGANAGRTCTSDQVSALVGYTVAADVGWVLALAGAGMGAVFLLLNGGGGEEGQTETAVVPVPWASPAGGGVVLEGRF